MNTFKKHQLDEDTKYKCDQCNFYSKRRYDLKLHKRSKHEGVVYSCDQCEYQAMTQKVVKNHQQVQHEGIRYSCDQCDYEGVRYYCDQCDVNATTVTHLNRHKQSIHEDISVHQKEKLVEKEIVKVQTIHQEDLEISSAQIERKPEPNNTTNGAAADGSCPPENECEDKTIHLEEILDPSKGASTQQDEENLVEKGTNKLQTIQQEERDVPSAQKGNKPETEKIFITKGAATKGSCQPRSKLGETTESSHWEYLKLTSHKPVPETCRAAAEGICSPTANLEEESIQQEEKNSASGKHMNINMKPARLNLNLMSRVDLNEKKTKFKNTFMFDGWSSKERKDEEESEDEDLDEDALNEMDDFNRKMYIKWKEARTRKKKMTESDWLSGEEGREKRIREKKWREMKEFLEQNQPGWKSRRKEEIKKLKEADKEDRVRRVKEKQKKFGTKNVGRKETKEEKIENDRKLQEMEIKLEIRGNMWKQYRVNGTMVKPRMKTLTIKNWKRKKLEKLEEEKKTEQIRMCWELMLACIKDAEEDDAKDGFQWVLANDTIEHQVEATFNVETAIAITPAKKRKKSNQQEDFSDSPRKLTRHLSENHRASYL